MSILMHGPNCIMDSSGDFLMVAELTKSMSCPFCYDNKDIYMMVLNSCDLCSIITKGGILSFTVALPLISPYCTTLAYLFLIFSTVLACRDAMEVDEFSKGCGLQYKVAYVWYVIQSRPPFWEHPL